MNGDSYASFEGLAFTVASGIRAGLLGYSQWGSDTGGYLRPDGTPEEELWARWMFASAFSPMYEILIGRGHTPWYEYSPRLVEILRITADLHTRLIPYIRSYTYHAAQTGIPVIRALFLEYPDDEAVAATADAYAVGAEFFVAPIVAGGGSRTVYFPRGRGRFLEYFNKTAVVAPGTTLHIAGLPLEYSPVYVREGAIVPAGDLHQGNAKWIRDWKPSLQVEIFPSFAVAQSTFEYFRGPGLGTATITVITDPVTRQVWVESDGLGIDATLLVYGRNGTVRLPMPLGGVNVGLVQRIQEFESLFDP